MGFPTRRLALFDGSSGQSSTFTSSWHLVADYDVMTVSLTLEASNDDGLTSAISFTSTLTGITADGIYTVDPGMRFIRALRNSNESLAEVFIQAQM
jgi:hypothetical protein